MPDPIQEALRAGQQALCNRLTCGDCACARGDTSRRCDGEDAAAAIAAFLRALPRAVVLAGGGSVGRPDVLAAEVERLARSAARA